MMHTNLATSASTLTPIGLPKTGRVYALVIGIENYQNRGQATLQAVEYACNDAQQFTATLRAIYPEENLKIIELIDSAATLSDMRNELKQIFYGIDKDDLFIFYYAGHGFHSVGGNRLTAWETHPHNLEDTTLFLRSDVFDRIEKSSCTRSLIFVDACASGFDEIGRDVISNLNTAELREFLSLDSYSGIFLSCEPGQKSYPSNRLKHGIWTYFLLQALNGHAEEALGPDRYLTDTSLRDYLRKEVPRFITRNTELKGKQNPQAIITASNTFAIRHVPEPHRASSPEGDLSVIRFTPTREFFEGVESGLISSLPGFSKKVHFTPNRVSEQSTVFVRNLIAEQVNEQVQELYEKIKSTFRLRRSGITQASGDGQGSIDIEALRFSIDVRQARSDPSEYRIRRQLELREDAAGIRDKIDEVFGAMFQSIVIEKAEISLDFDELVNLFEDIEANYGGHLKEEQNKGRVTYTGPDGTVLVFNVDSQRVKLRAAGTQKCSSLLARANNYRFGLTAASRLLLR